MPDPQPAPASKVLLWTGRVISGLPVLALGMSATMKFLQPPDVVDNFGKLGYPLSLSIPLGIVEIACTVLYVIPQTSILGAILLTGYLGGATATHVRLQEDFSAPVIVGVLVWVGLYLREPRLRALVPLKM